MKRILLSTILIFAFVIPLFAAEHCLNDWFPPRDLEYICKEARVETHRIKAYKFGSWPKYDVEAKVDCRGWPGTGDYPAKMIITANSYNCWNEGDPWRKNPEPKWLQIQAYNNRLMDYADFLDDYGYDSSYLKKMWK